MSFAITYCRCSLEHGPTRCRSLCTQFSLYLLLHSQNNILLLLLLLWWFAFSFDSFHVVARISILRPACLFATSIFFHGQFFFSVSIGCSTVWNGDGQPSFPPSRLVYDLMRCTIYCEKLWNISVYTSRCRQSLKQFDSFSCLVIHPCSLVLISIEL